MNKDTIKLLFENKALKKKNDLLNIKVKNLERKIKIYEEKTDLLIAAAVDKAVSALKKEYEIIVKNQNKKIAKLESQLNINSDNSSVPPSKNSIKTKITNSREKSNKKIGAQVGHKRNTLNYFNDDEITDTIEHSLDKCPNCNGSLIYKNTVLSDVIDFKTTVTKVRNKIHNYCCSCCNKNISSNTLLKRGTVYGNNINTSALILMNESNVAINKVRKYIYGLSNSEIDMSEGYISKLQAKTANKLDGFISELKNAIILEKIVHWDDTNITVGTKQNYLRFYGNEKLALLIAHENKNREGIKNDGILSSLGPSSTLVHDHVLYNYNKEFKFNNAECNAHILRYLKAVTENIHDHTWEKELGKLLNEANKNKNGKSCFDQTYIDEICRRYDEIIKLAYKEHNTLPDYHFYHSDEIKLIKRLDTFRDAHLLFVKDFDVPFSNNTAERSFRISKTKLKVSGLFQNQKSSENYAKILSYTETCYRNGVNKYQAILRLLDGNPYTVSELTNSVL
ncbi:MAG: transposase [Bacilli bacterium]